MKTQECFDFTDGFKTFDLEQSCLVNCKATQENDEGKEVYCVAVFGSKLQLKKEVNRPSVSVKLYMFSCRSKQVQLSSELCWMNFCVSFLPWIWHPSNIFVRNLSFLLSCLLFNENLPRKFPRKSREIGRFLREFVSSNPVKFHFFSRELSEALKHCVKRLCCARLCSFEVIVRVTATG